MTQLAPPIICEAGHMLVYAGQETDDGCPICLAIRGIESFAPECHFERGRLYHVANCDCLEKGRI